MSSTQAALPASGHRHRRSFVRQAGAASHEGQGRRAFAAAALLLRAVHRHTLGVSPFTVPSRWQSARLASVVLALRVLLKRGPLCKL